MNADKLKNKIESLCCHILFNYKGKQCGVDPISRTEIDVWYGENFVTADSVEAALKISLFDGKSVV